MIQHGVRSTYTNLKCRCTECVAAERAYYAGYYANPVNRDRLNALSKTRYYADTQKYRVRAQKRESLGQAFIDAAMAGGCVDCGNKNLTVLELDHVRGKKVNAVSHMASDSLSRLFAEIDKCETRCANCHRIKTAERRKAS